MKPQAQAFRQLLIAFLAALWIHVGVIFVVILLLIFEVLAGKEIQSERVEEEPAPKEDYSELVLSFEEDLPLEVEPLETSEEEATPSPPPEAKEKFARTRDDQISDAPIKAEFIGERNTKATSDADAMAGKEKRNALSGEEKKRKDNQTFDSQFSDGEQSGPRKSNKVAELSDLGKEETTEDSIEVVKKEMKPSEKLLSEEKAEEFVDIDDVIKKIEDAMAKDEKKEKVEEKVKPEIKVVEKKKAASLNGGFNSQTSKTKVRGVLSARGIGSLNVKNSAVGAYGSHIFREIEREWQMGNFRYQSLIYPGQITLYFVIDKKGNVSKQRRIEMNGASGMQWGIILNSVKAAKIPPMSKKVIEELGGEDLELTMGFTYN